MPTEKVAGFKLVPSNVQDVSATAYTDKGTLQFLLVAQRKGLSEAIEFLQGCVGLTP